jgi:hypothetical protein
MKLLILDETSQSSVGVGVTYSEYIDPQENIELIIITSSNSLSDQDKNKCLEWVEIPSPSQNGELELIAYQLHKKHKFDKIYTKQEDLILRAAYLRKYLGLEGLQPHEAILFRNKYEMKCRLRDNEVCVGPFELVTSPCDIVQFFETYQRIVVKPIMGSASQGIHLITNVDELQCFLRDTFFTVTNQMEYHHEWMVEKFIDGVMYHVNGIMADGELKAIWPFQYLNTNYDFTKGSFYGNAIVQPTDDMYTNLVEMTNKVLKALPLCNVFHLELFYHEQELFVCEIAARRPGGSIGLLIAEITEPSFPLVEFRINNNLPVDVTIKPVSIGDVLIPKPVGTLTKIPHTVPFGTIKVFGKIGDIYKGFDINHLNTLARIVCKGEGLTDLVSQLQQSAAEFASLLEYTLE